MNLVICYENNEGQCCICYPAAGARQVKSIRYRDKNGQLVQRSSLLAMPLEKLTGMCSQPAELTIFDGESDLEFARRIAAKDCPAGIPHRILRRDSIPTDRTFRNAWEDDGTAIKVNMIKARAIHKEKLLRDRDEKLKALRDSVEDAEDRGDAARLVILKAQRKRLRDLDSSLDAQLAAITTPEALKAFVPAELA